MSSSLIDVPPARNLCSWPSTMRVLHAAGRKVFPDSVMTLTSHSPRSRLVRAGDSLEDARGSAPIPTFFRDGDSDRRSPNMETVLEMVISLLLDLVADI